MVLPRQQRLLSSLLPRAGTRRGAHVMVVRRLAAGPGWAGPGWAPQRDAAVPTPS